MGVVAEKLQRHRQSSEQALATVVPWLARFRAHRKRLAGEGGVMAPTLAEGARGLFGQVLAGPSVRGDRSTEAMARSAMRALRRVVDLLDRHTIAGRGCPPLEAFEEALALLDRPRFADWLEHAPCRDAFDRESASLYREAIEERRAEAKERTRRSLAPGMEVALCSLGGWPRAFGHIIGGDADAGFVMEDGRKLAFSDAAWGAWWAFEADGKAAGLDARPARATDRALVAARAGRLAADGSTIGRRAAAVPREGFEAALAPGRDAAFAPGGHDLEMDDIVAEVLPGLGYGPLLAYMLRRFGPAPMGGDDYKDLCGSWCLTSPHPAVRLLVSPSVTGRDFCLRAVVEKGALSRLNLLGRLARDPDSGGGAGADYVAALGEMTAALRACAADLKRAVFVRDEPINALGDLRDSSPLAATWSTAYSQAATVGIPAGLLVDRDAFYALADAALALDPDPAAALAKALGLLEEAPRPHTATEPFGPASHEP